MKKWSQLMCLSLLICLLAACGETHFLKDEAYRQQVQADLATKQAQMPDGNLFAILNDSSLTLYEREAMQFLYAYMSPSDIADYTGEYHLQNVRLSEQARREMPWGKVVTDELFRHFVLPVRVNNENLDEGREVFYNELKDRVQHLSMKEAILEVNHWCHEKVTYRPTDSRTCSPLASIKTAYGRCGEESTFTVSALRAVGIPARQVYTPRWAHTDNNHAWVEAWADGQWYFFGACEPEPVLNLGWFNAPASRGMLMHTKVFGHYAGPEEIMRETANFTEINVIDNYAPTAKIEVLVKDVEGKPVETARVEFKVYNYAEYFTVATKFTDAEGHVSLTAGKGDMLLWASSRDGKFAYRKVSFGKDQSVEMVLDKSAGEAYTVQFDIVPPVEGSNLTAVTDEQRAENDRRFAFEDSIRRAYEATMLSDVTAAAWVDSFYNKSVNAEQRAALVRQLVASRGNHGTIKAFLAALRKDSEELSHQEELAFQLLDVVMPKDLRDITLEVLNDHLYNTIGEAEHPALFKKALLNPRVAHEMLTPYKQVLREALQGEKEITDVESLVNWVRTHVTINNKLNTQRIVMTPMGVWKARVTDNWSRDFFFVAAARSLGFPAWVDPVTRKVQYMSHQNKVVDVDFEAAKLVTAKQGTLKATYQPIASLVNPKYYSHFTISKFVDGTFQLLNYEEGDADLGEGTTWKNLLKNGTKLDEGYYMLTTGSRMASGAALAHTTFFTIEAGKTTTIPLEMRESKTQVQVIGEFNSEALYQPLDKELPQSILATTGRGYFVVGILGVGGEPTNHALRDIALLREDFEKWGRKMVLLFPTAEQQKKFNLSEFPGLPNTISYGIDTDHAIQDHIVKSMNLVNRNSLPIFIIADTFNRVVFVSHGYTIGLGEQLMKVVHGL